MTSWRILAAGALTVIFLACGSAIENDDLSGNGDPTESVAPASALNFGTYDVYADPLSGLAITPLTGASETVARAFALENKDGFLADITPAVGFGAGWNTTIYDRNSNKLSLLSGVGPCLTNSTGQTLYGLRAVISDFSPSGVIAAEGAVSNGASYDVSFQNIPNGGTACRPFSLTNSAGSSFRFHLNFSATSADSNPLTAQLSAVTTVWTYQGVTTTISGGGTGFPGTWNGTGHVFVNGVETVANGNVLTGTSTTFAEHVESVLAGPGILTVNTPSTGTLTGPYIIQPQSVAFTAQLPPGSGSVTSTVFWIACSGGCTFSANNCVRNISITDRESTANVTLTDSTFNPINMVALSTPSPLLGMQVAFDLNRNGVIDSGDVATYQGSLAASAGTITTMAASTLSTVIAGTCSY